jgi:hypothetical protein
MKYKLLLTFLFDIRYISAIHHGDTELSTSPHNKKNPIKR